MDGASSRTHGAPSHHRKAHPPAQNAGRVGQPDQEPYAERLVQPPLYLVSAFERLGHPPPNIFICSSPNRKSAALLPSCRF